MILTILFLERIGYTIFFCTIKKSTQLQHKTALITGAAQRTGRGIAKYLHANGYRVAVHCYRSVQEGEQLVTELNQQRSDSAFLLIHNLCEPQVAEAIVQKVEQQWGELSLLVNNASVFYRSKLHTQDLENWQDLFYCNTIVPYALSIAARNLLAKQKGCIINITDIHAQKPMKGYALYCQSKAALCMQTRTLAREFAPEVRVNSIAPGTLQWPEGENSLNTQQKEALLAATPLARQGEPLYIAQAVLALAENPFITGQSLAVDGGRSIR